MDETITREHVSLQEGKLSETLQSLAWGNTTSSVQKLDVLLPQYEYEKTSCILLFIQTLIKLV